jgi:polyhydroxyalkanoate synthesis regulator phasin
VRRELRKVGDDASQAHIEIENLRHDLGIFREGEPSPLEQRVSALEVRVDKLEDKRTKKKKSGTAAESRRRS